MINWVIDTTIFESETDQGDFLPALEQSGSKIHLTKYRPFDTNLDYGPAEWINQPTVLYGSWNWLHKCKIGYTPGAFGMNNNMNCNVYYNYVPKDWLLNGRNIVTTFGQFQREPEYYYTLMETNDLFIRPMSGFKTFTGFTSNILDIHSELNSSMQLTSVIPETYIMLSEQVKILAEYRFLIVNREVVDGSQYRKHDKQNIQSIYTRNVWNLAMNMSQLEWQPDAAYTCDVAETPHGVSIIELNSFACAGMYGLDKPKIIRAINQQALREFEGNLQ